VREDDALFYFFVMAGQLDPSLTDRQDQGLPAIHVFLGRYAVKAWMPGTRPGMTVF
jgi:hypothetical protein